MGDDDEPTETVVNDAAYWVDHLDDLRGKLSSAPAEVVTPPGRTNPRPVSLAVRDPAYWRAEPAALREALVLAEFNFFEHAIRVPVPDTVPEDRRLTFTVEEAAERLGIGRATAYEAVARSEIPSIRIGRRILVPRAALERMLDGGGEAPTTEGP
ncbi:MAG: helix-turn-helix domain-containing protein [Acidimicrobiales bacterium]